MRNSIGGIPAPLQLIGFYLRRRATSGIHAQRPYGRRTLCRCAGFSALRPKVQARNGGALDFRRGAKKKSTVKMKDLPQGALKLEPYDDGVVDDGPRYPAVLQGHLNNMQKFKNCIVLTRVGGFYEVWIDFACVTLFF